MHASKVGAAEPRIAVVRAAIVTTNVVVYAFLSHESHITWLAHAVILVALAYSYGVLIARPYHRWSAAATATFTACTDGVLIALWILATGGVDSPYYLLWYASLIAVSFRFGLRESLITAVAYASGYLLLVWATGGLADNVPVVALRCAYILAVGTLAGLNGEFSYGAARARDDMGSRMREAQDAEEKVRSILAAAPDAIVIAGADGKVLMANEQALSVFGARRVEPGNASDALVAPGSLDAFRRMVSQTENAATTSEIAVIASNGAEVPMEVRVSRLTNGDGPLVTAVFRDLTERKQAERERLEHAERLKEFEHLKELEAFRTQFINTAAHELGTPLTPIRMQVHLLRRNATALSPEQMRSLEILDRNVDRLGILVQEILDGARMQASRLGVDRKPADINGLVLEAVESFHEAAAQAGIRLEPRLGIDIRAMADEKRIMQVLFNLLGNALKFTPPGGRIVVETRRVEGAAIVVSVQDSGIGIEAEDQKRLFQPFSQLEAGGRRVGAGLGLYISRGLIELHGGRLWCESAGRTKGSKFSFSLPLVDTTAAVTATPPVADPGFAQRLRELA